MKKLLAIILSILTVSTACLFMTACSKTEIADENYTKYIDVVGDYEGDDFYIKIIPANEQYTYKNVKIKIDVLLLLSQGSNMSRGAKSLIIKLDENGYGKEKISVTDGVFAMLQDFNIVSSSGNVIIPE